MEEDFFLKKMKGVKPLKDKENIFIQKKNNKKITKKSIFSKKTTTIKKNTETKITNNVDYKLSFGEINRDLKRGKIKIDRRVDLHGYSLLDACEKFKNEIIKNYNSNKRCLLIITGKGNHVANQKKDQDPKLFHGKIKNSIISWINQEDLKNYILTYQVAGIEHGGDGAIFVYLRKKRS